MSSDSTGEIYVLLQVEVSAGSPGGGDGTGTGTGTGTTTSGVSLAPRSSRNRPGIEAIWLTFLAVVLSLVCGVSSTWD